MRQSKKLPFHILEYNISKNSNINKKYYFVIQYINIKRGVLMKIGIVGLGLIGGTIAKALNTKHNISAYDISNESLSYALKNQIIHKAYTNLHLFLQENEVIYLCLYPNSLINFIFENKVFIPKNSVIIEISGIKQHIISSVEQLGELEFEMVYSHPVAGREKSGVWFSDKDIFSKGNYVITPTKNNNETTLKLAEKLAKEMGFNNISYVSPKEHDDIIAYTSQLTHVLSISLVNALSTNLDTSRFIGDSYRDLTRISMINDTLWSELFLYNRDALLEQINHFRVQLDHIQHALLMNDKENLMNLMQSSTQIRQSIEEGKTHDR